MSNKTFRKIAKPFLTSKGCVTNDWISSEKYEDTWRNEKVLVELLNEMRPVFAKRSSGKKLSSFGSCEDSALEDILLDEETISK